MKAELKTDVLNLENKIVALEVSNKAQSETIRKLEQKIDHLDHLCKFNNYSKICYDRSSRSSM